MVKVGTSGSAKLRKIGWMLIRIRSSPSLRWLSYLSLTDLHWMWSSFYTVEYNRPMFLHYEDLNRLLVFYLYLWAQFAIYQYSQCNAMHNAAKKLVLTVKTLLHLCRKETLYHEMFHNGTHLIIYVLSTDYRTYKRYDWYDKILHSCNIVTVICSLRILDYM